MHSHTAQYPAMEATEAKATPTKPHFFKPLLPDFHHGLAIPVAFYNHYLNDDGKSKNRDAVLRTVLGEWKVKIKDRRFIEEDGWRSFAQHHDLHVGDMVVFGYEGDLVFDVMVFDPSACERCYDHDDYSKSVPLVVKQEVPLQKSTGDRQPFLICRSDQLLKEQVQTTEEGHIKVSTEENLQANKVKVEFSGYTAERSTQEPLTTEECHNEGQEEEDTQSSQEIGKVSSHIVVRDLQQNLATTDGDEEIVQEANTNDGQKVSKEGENQEIFHANLPLPSRHERRNPRRKRLMHTDSTEVNPNEPPQRKRVAKRKETPIKTSKKASLKGDKGKGVPRGALPSSSTVESMGFAGFLEERVDSYRGMYKDAMTNPEVVDSKRRKYAETEETTTAHYENVARKITKAKEKLVEKSEDVDVDQFEVVQRKKNKQKAHDFLTQQGSKATTDTRDRYEQEALGPSSSEPSSSEDEGPSKWAFQKRSTRRSVEVEDDKDYEDEDYAEEEDVEDDDDEEVEKKEEEKEKKEKKDSDGKEDEEGEENDGEGDPESHHGNAINAYVRYKNVRLYQLKKSNSDKRMTKTYLAQIQAEWPKLSLGEKNVYLFGAQAERQKRKKEGTMKRRTKAEIKKDKLKKVEKKEVKKVNPKGLKYSRRWQSFMSLPSMVSIFKSMTEEQTAWLYEVGLGGLTYLKIEKTPEAFNKFIYSCYDVEGYLIAHGRSVEMTEETVEWLLGIRCTGETTFPKHEKGVVREIQDELGLMDSYTPIKDFLPWFQKKENKELFNDEWKRRVVIFILACIGLPVTRQGVRRTLAEYVVDLEYLKSVNWAAIWLEHIRKQQIPVQQGKSVRGAGCVLIPLLLYMEKFCPKLQDLPKGCKNLQDSPRLKLWETKDIIDRWNFVKDGLKHLKLKRNEEPPTTPVIPPTDELVQQVVGKVMDSISERLWKSFLKKKAEMDEKEQKEKRKKKKEKKHMDDSEEEKAREKKRKRKEKEDNKEEKAREKKRERKIEEEKGEGRQ